MERPTITGDTLHVNLTEILSQLSRDDLLKLADSLAIRDDVFDYVAQQLLEGWTEQSSHAATAYDLSDPDLPPLSKWRKLIAESASAQAKELIQNLVFSLRYSRGQEDAVRTWGRSLEQATLAHFRKYHGGGIPEYFPKAPAMPTDGLNAAAQYAVVPKSALQSLVDAAKAVPANWESGDLAGAVRDLVSATEAMEKAIHDLS